MHPRAHTRQFAPVQVVPVHSGAEGATRRMAPYAAGAASHNKPWRPQHAQPTNRTFPASDPAFSACRRRAGRRRAAYLHVWHSCTETHCQRVAASLSTLGEAAPACVGA